MNSVTCSKIQNMSQLCFFLKALLYIFLFLCFKRDCCYFVWSGFKTTQVLFVCVCFKRGCCHFIQFYNRLTNEILWYNESRSETRLETDREPDQTSNNKKSLLRSLVLMLWLIVTGFARFMSYEYYVSRDLTR